MGVHAIDVSRWQGTISWPAVRDSGVKGAWIKVGGSDGGLYADSRAATNLAGARDAGVPFGTYYFAVPGQLDARAQARHALSIRYGEGGLWPALDLERNDHGLTAGQVDQWVTDFCDEVVQRIGRESIFYGGKGLVGHSDHPPRCPLWISNYGDGKTAGTLPPSGWYPTLPPAWTVYDIWQFNSITRIPGIPDNSTDQNVVTDAFWARMTQPQEVDVTPDECKQAVREVLAEPDGTLAHWLGDTKRSDMLLIHDVSADRAPQWWMLHGFLKRRVVDGYEGFEDARINALNLGDQAAPAAPIGWLDDADEIPAGVFTALAALAARPDVTVDVAALAGIIVTALGSAFAAELAVELTDALGQGVAEAVLTELDGATIHFTPAPAHI